MSIGTDRAKRRTFRPQRRRTRDGVRGADSAVAPGDLSSSADVGRVSMLDLTDPTSGPLRPRSWRYLSSNRSGPFELDRANRLEPERPCRRSHAVRFRFVMNMFASVVRQAVPTRARSTERAAAPATGTVDSEHDVG